MARQNPETMPQAAVPSTKEEPQHAPPLSDRLSSVICVAEPYKTKQMRE
jgi:hypothetical protein